MDRLTIKILPNGFSYSNGSGARTRKEVVTIYNWVERKLKRLSPSLASPLKGKTVIRVVYGDGGLNEAESSNPKELLFSLLCFLEDYVGKVFFNAKRKLYI